ncbi:MAG TPA: protein kinase [Bryobacteraceae bacterium]|nr:protein kinase [Bryobacteraceae bacterium]
MPSRIGKYTVERELGHGGFGVVYLAFDPDMGQPVAIKKLRAEGDADLLRRFQVEIRTTASLRHKNIVTIHASGEEAGDPYLVMEFLEGQTLKQVIRERRPLSLLDKVRIMTQVAEGLAYAHSKGVIHRDVKPENIMLLPDDNVKIMDFGIALAPNRSTAFTQTGGIIGTPSYFAPEQLQGSKAGEQTDIFSFGDVYYELLTGVHPFERYKDDWRSLQIAILSYDPEPVGELVPGCPEALETLVHRTLAKEPEFRYRTFEEVHLDSEAILVDLKHEGAAEILRELPALMDSGNLQTALSRVLHAYQLDPGNREVRRLREEINLQIRKQQVQARVEEFLAEAEQQMGQKRYAEAVENLEAAVRLDSTNLSVRARLEEANARRDASLRVSRLISEARFRRQKGNMAEAQELLRQALEIVPDHTVAGRLSQHIQAELERRRLQQRRQEAIRAARNHLSEKRYEQALAALEEVEREMPGDGGLSDLRLEIERQKEEEDRRVRAERFHLALTRAREAMQAEDLDRAGPMLDYLEANFGADPGAGEVLPRLREELGSLARAREIAGYQQAVRGLLKDQSFRKALELLAEALPKFPEDAGLERLKKTAEELYEAHRRSEEIAEVVREIRSKRDAGDLEGAMETISRGRQRLGDDAAFMELLRQTRLELDQQRYGAALDSLLKEARELLAAGRHSEAIGRLSAPEFRGEAEVKALLESARSAATMEEERRFAEDALSAAGQLASDGAWAEALKRITQALVRYPHNPRLIQSAGQLRDRVEEERRRQLVETHRAAIRKEIEQRHWERAEEALRQARAALSDSDAFADLADQVAEGVYEDGWRALAAQVRQNVANNRLSEAEDILRNDRTRTMYAQDGRWNPLAAEVERRRNYEDALAEAGRRREAGHLSEAEELLTEVIEHGAPDRRAHQMRGAIQLQRSEGLRQQEIARIAGGIRDCLARQDTGRAAADLALARARYPGEQVWAELQAELDTRQQARRRASEIAAAAQAIRESIGRDAIPQAAEALAAARAKYPGEAVWAPLAEEIAARRADIERRQEIAAAAEGIRGCLTRRHPAGPGEPRTSALAAAREIRQEDLRDAAAALDAARVKYPGEAIWDQLQPEVEERSRFLAGEAEAVLILQQQLDAHQYDEAEIQLRSARAKYPDEDLWNLAQALIARGRKIAQLHDRIRGCLDANDCAGARSELDRARTAYPEERGWAELQAELAAREAALARQAEIAAAGERVRARILEDLSRAAAQLEEAQAEYPGEALWHAIQIEIEARRTEIGEARRRAAELVEDGRPAEAIAFLEEGFSREAGLAEPLAQARQALERQRQREMRDGALHRLLELEHRIEEGGRRRRTLDREAQQLVSGYLDDAEMAAIASRIHARVEEARAQAAAQRRMWWKRAGMGAGAAGVLASLALVAVKVFSPPPSRPKPPAPATIRVEIRTDPPGASVRMGAYSCATPGCFLQVRPGTYDVDAQLQGYQAGMRTVTVNAANQVVEVTLQPVAPAPAANPPVAAGSLVVRTGVPDALVYVDGTPLTRTDRSGSATLALDAKVHQVRVERNGYLPSASKQVAVAAGGQKTVTFVLALQSAGLEVAGAPAGVEVRVDGKLLGRTDGSPIYRFPAPVAPGERTVEVAQGLLQAGQGAAAGSVTERFDPGQTVQLSWRLPVAPRPAPAPAPAPVPPAVDPVEVEWNGVRDTSDPGKLREFLKNHPNSRYTQPAQQALDRLAWSNTNQANPDSLRAYLQNFPAGAHAAEAKSQIADLLWKGVDPGNIEQVRKFIADNPNNPHVAEARRILDQFRARQALLENQALATVKSFNQALQKKQRKQLKALWPGISTEFIESVEQPGQRISLDSAEVTKIEGGIITIRCTLNTTIPRPKGQNAILVLRQAGDRWTIASLAVNP